MSLAFLSSISVLDGPALPPSAIAASALSVFYLKSSAILGYFSFVVFYLSNAACIISISLRLVISFNTSFFYKKSGIWSKPPFLPPSCKAGRELIATEGSFSS